MLVISCQDCQKNRTCHRCVHSLSWYSWSWHVLYWRCFVCYSDVVLRFGHTMHVLCTHSYSVLIIVCFSLVFHIVFALGSLDARVPVRLPLFCLFIYVFFAFRVSTSSGDIFALLYSLSICYGSFVIIWYDGEAVAFVQNIFRFLTAQVCEWTTHHAELSFSA